MKKELTKEEKIKVYLAVLLTVSYGLTLAASGVSLPGCGEGAP